MWWWNGLCWWGSIQSSWTSWRLAHGAAGPGWAGQPVPLAYPRHLKMRAKPLMLNITYCCRKHRKVPRSAESLIAFLNLESLDINGKHKWCRSILSLFHGNYLLSLGFFIRERKGWTSLISCLIQLIIKSSVEYSGWDIISVFNRGWFGVK